MSTAQPTTGAVAGGGGTNPPAAPGYLTGFPHQTSYTKKGRRDKSYRKFHIPCLEIEPPRSTNPSVPYNSKPYIPLVIPDWVRTTKGSGKAAKKARRRAKKRAYRKQAKQQAEAEARQAAEASEADLVQIEEDKRRRTIECYRKFKEECSKQEVERNIVKTRNMSKKTKEEGREAAKVKAKKGAKANEEEAVPGPEDAGYEDAVAAAKAGKGKANALDKSSTKKRKRDDEDETSAVTAKKQKTPSKDAQNDHKKKNAGKATNEHATSSNKRKRGDEDEISASAAKKQKTTTYESDNEHDSLFEFEEGEESDVDDSDDESVASVYDPIATLPDIYQKPESLADFADEILERIIDACDPISRTLLGLTNKRLGRLVIDKAAGFPIIRDRYGSDLERQRFMGLLEGWMNRKYSESPEPITIAEGEAREKLKERRLCYICRKYLPISGKKLQYWKNCPKKADMPDDPASVAARDAEMNRRQQLTNNIQGGASAQSLIGVLGGPPKVKKQKPKAQEILWENEHWTTLSIGTIKSRERLRDVKHICPKCTLTVHTIHLGWPPETPIVRWLEQGNPAGGKMATGHEPLGMEEDTREGDLDEDIDVDPLHDGMNTEAEPPQQDGQ